MVKLSPQKKYLVELYQDGEWKCSTAIQFVRDFRKRISELNTEGYIFESKKCDGRCGIAHNSNVHMYRIDYSSIARIFLGEKSMEKVYYVRHPLTGARITVEEMKSL